MTATRLGTSIIVLAAVVGLGISLFGAIRMGELAEETAAARRLVQSVQRRAEESAKALAAAKQAIESAPRDLRGARAEIEQACGGAAGKVAQSLQTFYEAMPRPAEYEAASTEPKDERIARYRIKVYLAALGDWIVKLHRGVNAVRNHLTVGKVQCAQPEAADPDAVTVDGPEQEPPEKL